MNTQKQSTYPLNPDYEPLDGSTLAREIARKAKLAQELRALEEREHEKGFFDMPINA